LQYPNLIRNGAHFNFASEKHQTFSNLTMLLSRYSQIEQHSKWSLRNRKALTHTKVANFKLFYRTFLTTLLGIELFVSLLNYQTIQLTVYCVDLLQSFVPLKNSLKMGILKLYMMGFTRELAKRKKLKI